MKAVGYGDSVPLACLGVGNYGSVGVGTYAKRAGTFTRTGAEQSVVAV